VAYITAQSQHCTCLLMSTCFSLKCSLLQTCCPSLTAALSQTDALQDHSIIHLWVLNHLNRPRLPTIWIHHDFNCHINEKETPKTCLTNHKGSVYIYHTIIIMPLVINSLRGRDTHTHTHTYRPCRQKQFQKTSCVLAFGWHVPGLNIGLSQLLIMSHKNQLLNCTCEDYYETYPVYNRHDVLRVFFTLSTSK